MNRIGQPWTATEDAQLIKAFNDGASIHKLVLDHERTGNAIVSRLCLLGRLTVIHKAYHVVEDTPWTTFDVLRNMDKPSTN